ncbi:MAG: hypothetical protein HQL77_16675 [Magnetococcales bacterium]|nr:hypothetical protein [Magnetococcales bacterium]
MDDASAPEPRESRRDTVLVRPVLDADLGAVCQFFHEHLGGGMSVEVWKNAFSQQWMPDRPNHGYMLLDGERVVGAFGAIYAQRSIRGNLETFCNHNSWVVLPAYRAKSLGLLHALLRQKGYHVTVVTPNPKVARIYELRGYRPLGGEILVLSPLTSWHPAPGARVIADAEGIVAALPADAARDFSNHRMFPWLRQLACGDSSGMCHIVYRLGRWKRMPAAKILHVGDGDVFNRVHAALGRYLLLKHGVMTMHVPSRLVPDRPWGSFTLVDGQARLFHSETLNERDISYLYTELAALDLP